MTRRFNMKNIAHTGWSHLACIYSSGGQFTAGIPPWWCRGYPMVTFDVG